MTNYTLEREYKIYNDKNGARLRIGPDLDGLGLIEIDGGNDYGRLIVPEDVAGYLAHAILMALEDLKGFQAGIDEKLRPERVADRDGWVNHDGKDMPVASDILVEVVFRSGDTNDALEAGAWHANDVQYSNWVHDGYSGDIMRYRVVPQ